MARLSSLSSIALRSRVAQIATVLAVSTLAHGARAQASAADAAAAEALYDEGAKLLEAGDYDNACPKLAESYRLDPALGALLSLAVCRERAGQLASAWATYLNVVANARAAKDEDRASAAKARADALAPRLPRLKVDLSAEVLALPGLSVTRDGQTVDPRAASTAVPVDPGDHVIEVRATGKAPSTQKVVAEEGKVEAVSIATLADASAASPDVGPGPVAPPTQPPAENDGGLTGLQTQGLVIAGVGVVGLGIGFVFGGMALGAHGELEDAGYTKETRTCTDVGFDECTSLYEDASSEATLSTIFVIAGGALAATGAVLVIVGGDGGNSGTEAARVELAPAPGGLLLRSSM